MLLERKRNRPRRRRSFSLYVSLSLCVCILQLTDVRLPPPSAPRSPRTTVNNIYTHFNPPRAFGAQLLSKSLMKRASTSTPSAYPHSSGFLFFGITSNRSVSHINTGWGSSSFVSHLSSRLWGVVALRRKGECLPNLSRLSLSLSLERIPFPACFPHPCFHVWDFFICIWISGERAREEN